MIDIPNPSAAEGDGMQFLDNNDQERSPPAKRHKPLSKACDYCKGKKLRCDSCSPQCGTCKRKGIECVYREKGQPGLRPGYGKEVEHRLGRLEQNLQTLSEAITTLVRSSNERLPQEDSSGPLNSSQCGNELNVQNDQPLPELFQQTVVDVPPRMSAAGLSDGTTQFHDPSLPPEAVLHELLRLFFEYVNPRAPLFHRTSFTTRALDADRSVLLHGVVVVTLRYWTSTDVSIGTKASWLKASRERIYLHCVENCTLTSTQALTLLALDAIAEGPTTRIWTLTSMLAGAVCQLGLAKERKMQSIDSSRPMVGNEMTENNMEASSLASEERRRLFWTIFSLDRFSSVALGQPGHISAKNIKLRYPANNDGWTSPSVADWYQPKVTLKPFPSNNAWRCYIEVLTLLDRSNRLLLHPLDLSIPAQCQEWQSHFRMLKVVLNTWLETCPEQARNPSEPFDPLWLTVRATYELVALRIFTVAAHPHARSTELVSSNSARLHCREAVTRLVQILRPLQPEYFPKLGSNIAFITWVAARSLLIIWITGYEGSSQTPPVDLDVLKHTLQQLSVLWPCATRYLGILEYIVRAKANPPNNNAIETFIDTRRTSYSLLRSLEPLSRSQDATGMDLSEFLDMSFLAEGDWNNTYNVPILDHPVDWLS